MSETPVPNRVFLGVAAVAIAITAVAIRWSSCRESFWLDELHSVWAVSGNFSDVIERASVGNQTTGYFHFLWFWQRCVGTSEVAMRMSSVLAVALASGLLVVGVAMQTRRVSAGLIAGSVLAIDPNAIFFGTELRPYAMVMLCSVLATWAAMTWLSGDLASRSHGGARYRLAMLFWICVAALIHPTSLGVLFWLLPLTGLVGWRRKRLNLWRADWIAVVIVIATLGLLAMSSLPHSWAKRAQWKAFGQATDWWQFFMAWDWVPIVLVPLAVAALFLVVASLRWDRTESLEGVVPLLVGVLGTLAFFAASYFDIVPLWHRRYYVAALPMLAWSAGVMGTLFAPRRRWAWIGLVVVVGFHLFYLTSLSKVPWPTQARYEPWREIVAMVEREPGEAVWVDTGLIEAAFFDDPIGDRPLIEPDWEYLAFPLRGAYRVDRVTVVSASEHRSWLEYHADSLSQSSGVWFIGRTSPAAADRMFGFVAKRASFTVISRRREGNLVLVHAVRRDGDPETSVAVAARGR
ncbi:MAG: hypothetical protein AAFX06_19175 [Planctomycetota bacterium]